MTQSTSTPFALRLPRLTGWVLITILLLLLVAVMAPHQLPVSLYKLSLVSLAGCVGYWLDRSLFPYARPDTFLLMHGAECPPLPIAAEDGSSGVLLDSATEGRSWALLCAAAMLRRAAIVGAAMLAMSLGA